MKLIEKMALDWLKECRKNQGSGFAFRPEIFHKLPPGITDAGVTAYFSFEAGFCAAREMAISALYESGSDPTGHGEDCIRSIGESEAED